MIEAKIYEKDRELFDSVRALPEDAKKLVRLKDIPFSSRSITVFSRMGLRTLGQLQQKTRYELMREPGMGKLGYEQIVFFMQELGLPMDTLPVPVSPVIEGPNRELLEGLLTQLKDMTAKLEEALR